MSASGQGILTVVQSTIPLIVLHLQLLLLLLQHSLMLLLLLLLFLLLQGLCMGLRIKSVWLGCGQRSSSCVVLGPQRRT